MDHQHSDSQLTPYNFNEPYANKFIIVITAIIAFLTIRHLLTYLPLNRQVSLLYQRVENTILNKLSYSASHGFYPPLGALFLTVVLISTLLPLLLLNVDLAVNSNRAGFLCLAIVPFLLSSTGKNPVICLLTGISAIKLNWLHRLLGMALFICATIHMSCMIHSWSMFPIFLKEKLKLSKVQYGVTGYAILCVIILGSAFPVRKYCYELFLGTHLLALAFIGVIAVHTPYAMRYFVAGLFCYLLNLMAVWFVKSYVAQARCEILPEGCTRISLRLTSPMPNHRIGQYVYLCIPALSPFQWHPFTITNIPAQPGKLYDKHLIEVHVCIRGNYTRNLYKKLESSQQLPVFVSGPFGNKNISAHKTLHSYSSVVIATGGSGITFGIRFLRELCEQLAYAEKTHYCCKNIYFAWSVHREGELEWFRNELEQICYYFEQHDHFPTLHMKLHVTSTGYTVERIARTTEDIASSMTKTQENNMVNNEVELIECESSSHITMSQAPVKSINVMYNERIQPSDYISLDGDLGIFVCGPSGFNAAFKNGVASASLKKASCISLHCEEFSY